MDLAYKNLTFSGKVEGKSLFSFGNNANAYEILKDAQNGDIFEIDPQKNEQGYLDWVSVKKDNSPATVAKAGAVPSTGTSYTPTKSSYPSDEERAKTQVYIVRQSNITAAINLLSVGAKSPPKLDDVIATAKQFEDHVFGTSNDPVDTAKPPVGHDFDDLDDLPQ